MSVTDPEYVITVDSSSLNISVISRVAGMFDSPTGATISEIRVRQNASIDVIFEGLHGDLNIPSTVDEILGWIDDLDAERDIIKEFV